MAAIDAQLLERAASFFREADALLIGAGAGMSVDSGLPDFRGPQGFWRAYPPLARLGLSFEEMANPQWFRRDPALAWGFYGHRLRLYRERSPHEGYAILRRWTRRCPNGYFVFTSNVDGHFLRAGFNENAIVECHGSIEWLQCTGPCSSNLWPAPAATPEVDEETLRAQEPLPRCPHCWELARPNVLMFGDWSWVAVRTEAQQERLEKWLERLSQSRARLVVVEIGAGSAIPTVRWTCETLSQRFGAPLVRINLREAPGPRGCLSLAGSALEVLRSLDPLVG